MGASHCGTGKKASHTGFYERRPSTHHGRRTDDTGITETIYR